MKLLISGPTGFIGKHLIHQLIYEGHTIIAIEKQNADVSFLTEHNIRFIYYQQSYKEVFDFIKDENPEGVIHLASLFLASHNPDQINELINTNILFPLHLIEAASNANIKWFINTGTFWQHYQNKDYSPVNLYAATKQSFEDLAKYYYESKEINFVTLQLSDTFGPNDIRQKIFNLWLRIAKTGEVLEMSPGEQLIDISYIDNIVEAYIVLVNLLTKDHQRLFCGKVYAMKAEKRYSLKELSILFSQITNCKLNIVWGKKEYRFREVMHPWQNGETIPGFTPKVTLEEGIKHFYDNLENNSSNSI